MTTASMEIVPVPCLTDNYAYVVRNGTDAVVVDPSEVGPVAATLEELGLTLRAILCTHHHHDHVGGVAGLLARFKDGVRVYAHPRDATHFEGVTHRVDDGARFVEAGIPFRVLHVPAHTLGAIGYIADERAVFTGDTMFVAGCGRLFEGTAAMMHRALCFGFAKLADDTQVFPGHEYAEKNLRFASEVEPRNTEVRAHLLRAIERRRAGLFCIPSTIGVEKATNPFLRVAAAEVQAFAKARGAKTNDPVDVLAAVRHARDKY